ncbi:hypothetical protein MTR67_026804 [Solanum verrucosum]|uniref:DUF4283 domain-containing protein n=1 Tax=Solanum verrucosum TaxID=315347 RepID=A0AAF0QZL5_SOLVR|nr:hypothetical protein MTR67_026804 [Solanum verrucosum]
MVYLHSEPQIIGKSSEVQQMIIQENLHYAILGKFSYDKLDLHELRKVIPVQCEIKGPCNIGLLENKCFNTIISIGGLCEDDVHPIILFEGA